MINSVGKHNFFHDLKLLWLVFTISIILLNSTKCLCIPAPTKNQNNPVVNNSVVLKDTLEKLVSLSEEYWSINRSKSDSLINRAFVIISRKKINDSVLIANAYHILGKNLVHKREFQNGIDTLKKCNKIKQKFLSDDFKSISKTLNYIGIGYNGLRIYDSAFSYYQKAKAPLIENSVFDINLYLVNLNIAIYYSSIGKYNTALSFYDTAFIVLEKSGLIKDSTIMSGYYYNYALYTTFTGKLKQANEYYEIVERIYGALHGHNSIGLAGVKNNQGINSYLGYELSKANLYFKKALDIHSFNNSKDNENIASTYYNLSKVYEEEGNLPLTIASCEKGLSYAPNNDLSLILNNILANSYATIGDNVNALKYFNITLGLLDNENINPNRKQDVYSDYASFLMNSGNNNLSLTYYLKSLKEAKGLHGEASDQYAGILSKIGNYYLVGEKNADSALFYYSLSINIYNNNNLDLQGHNRNLVTEKQAEVGYAKANRLKFQQTNNIDYLLIADTVLNNVLMTLEDISSQLTKNNKLIVIEAMYPIYLLSVENSYDLFKLTNNNSYQVAICDYMEKSKSSALLAEVNNELALKTSDLKVEIFEYEHQLKDDIYSIQQLLGKENAKHEPNQANISFFESKLLKLINKYDSLIIEIENHSPKYFSIKYENKVISLSDIKESLEDDEVLLEYLLTDTSLFIMGISQNNYRIVSVPIDSSFFTSLNYIISLKYVDLSKQNLQKFNEFKQHSYKLWKSLIEPQINLIGNNRLIIIPDGLLGYLPFDLLIEYDFEADKINYRDLPYLLKNHPLSYSYSATLKYNTYFDSNGENSKIDILAFSPSYEDNPSPSDALNAHLRNLPLAKTEVENIVNNNGGKAYFDIDATKQNFKKVAGSANILHLAMHTIINDSAPLQSKLVFYDDKLDTNSNYMFAHELYNMDLSAAMVTLSACNTGSGKFSKGEGIMSLARGFVYAGIPSIIMTLWEVQDVTGSKIMDNYYGFLASGMKKDVALQKAKLKTLKNANMANAHPFFWSAYIVNGNTSEFNVSPNHNYYYWATVFILIIALFFGLQFRNKTSKKV